MTNYSAFLRYGAGKLLVNLGSVPTTTLTATANPGDTVLHVADATKAREDDILTFWDGTVTPEPPPGNVTVEPAASVISTDPVAKTVTLGAALTLTHAGGATVATRLLRSVPEATGLMLRGDAAIWAVIVTEWASGEAGNMQWSQPTRLAIIRQWRATPSSDTVATQLWLEQQTAVAEQQINDLTNALKAEPRFIVDGVSYADQIVRFEVPLRRNIVSEQTPVYEVHVNLTLRGRPTEIA